MFELERYALETRVIFRRRKKKDDHDEFVLIRKKKLFLLTKIFSSKETIFLIRSLFIYLKKSFFGSKVFRYKQFLNQPSLRIVGYSHVRQEHKIC